jgi:hypothetical protein
VEKSEGGAGLGKKDRSYLWDMLSVYVHMGWGGASSWLYTHELSERSEMQIQTPA